MIYLTLLYITLLCVFIIDLTPFIDDIEEKLGKWLSCKVIVPKPFGCSLCLSWWIGLIIIFFNKPTLSLICYQALLSYLTPIIADVFIFLKLLLSKIITILYIITKVD